MRNKPVKRNMFGAYSIKELGDNHLHYWVVFPQGVVEKKKDSTSYGSILDADTKAEALRLLRKYDGAYIEKLVVSEKGRYCIGIISEPEYYTYTEDQLWDLWKDKPEVILY